MLLLHAQPLLRNAGKRAAACIVSYLCRQEVIQAQAAEFLDSTCTPAQDFGCKTINVLQGEYAVVDTRQEGPNICLSSCEATTCCILALSCESSGRFGIAHYDKPQAHSEDCLRPLLDGLVAPDLYIIGGYREHSNCGVATANRLLQVLDDADKPINVALACIGSINTAVDGAPKCCNLLLTKTASRPCLPSAFTAIDKEPLAIQRMARAFAQPAVRLQNIYDTSTQLLQIQPVRINLSRQQVLCFAALLECPDADFLEIMSTSPHHETASFVPGDVTLHTELCVDLGQAALSIMLFVQHSSPHA